MQPNQAKIWLAPDTQIRTLVTARIAHSHQLSLPHVDHVESGRVDGDTLGSILHAAQMVGLMVAKHSRCRQTYAHARMAGAAVLQLT